MKKVKYLPLKNFISYISRGITPKYTESDGICVLNQKCIRNNRISIVQARKHNIKAKNISNDKLLRKWDILVNSTGTGTLGRVAQIKQDVIATADSHITIVRPNQDVNAAFLGYALKYNQQSIEALAEGSTGQTELSKEKLKERILIPCFEYKEQAKISEILLYLDERLELNEKINQNLDWEDYFSICHKIIELEEENQNLEAQAQAIFKSWFVDFEPFKNGKFIDSELGKIPEGWTVNTLSNIVYLKKGKKPKELSEIKHENYIPYLTIDALSGGRPLFCDTEKMLLAKEKDILLVMDGASSGAIFYGLDGVVASTIIKLELTNTEIREIVFAFLNYKQLDLKSHTTGSAIPHLDKDRLLSYKIALPSNGKLLRKISGTLKSLRDNIIRNRKESRRLAQLRDTLLPKLMSGEIDVSDVAV